MLQELYYIRNMKIDSEYFPSVMPEKRALVSFKLMTKEKGAFKIFVNGEVLFKIENTFKNSQN